MTAHQVLATVAASDFGASRAWYARLFGRVPDNAPDAACAEWQIASRTRIQLRPRDELADAPWQAGPASLGIMVDNLDEMLRDLHTRQIDVPIPQLATHFVRVVPVRDPDGNMVTFVESAAA
ncbi:VOC family protein [Rhodanobacter sp. AS-Z3]|uniref:VOC family protein n=1 Tax=Rhodanobacter sp. AS-Z3 TaxID=3031330 RepID=UPI00247B0BB9|nr:VOC family protein [Rhodanobacter sp. AS-Z3]WEN14208.1 VOC family protein [Rhodanobacter sp. AS-Z3]